MTNHMYKLTLSHLCFELSSRISLYTVQFGSLLSWSAKKLFFTNTAMAWNSSTNHEDSDSESLSPVYRRPKDDPAPSPSKTRNVISKKHQDVLLVHGFIRSNTSTVPLDITNLCFMWFHSCAYFLEGSKGYTLSDDATQMTQNSGACGSCYGAMAMPSVSSIDVEYALTLQIIRIGSMGGGLCVGIDDAECAHLDDDFAGATSTENYAYFSQRGTLFTWETGVTYNAGQRYGVAYQTGDVIVMTFNPFRSVLRFEVNGKDQGEIRNIHRDEALSYRLCVASYGTTSSVKLLADH